MKKLIFILFIAIAICGYSVSAATTPEAKQPVANEEQGGMTYEELQSAYEQLEKFEAVFALVKQRYVEEKTDEEIIDLALDGMLSSLDPHSSFLNEEAMEDMEVSTKGEFGGLGIQITTEDKVVKVVSPIDDTPAEKAGVLAGDFITHLDGDPIIGIDLDDAVDRMRGEPGTEITLTVRQGFRGDPRDILIVRDIIKIDAVKSEVIDNIGYIRVATFSQKTRKELDKAFEDIGEYVDGYVLDLRNNPGGLLTMAIAVSEAFLDGGEVVSTRGRSEIDKGIYYANTGDKAKGKPVVVIINQGSASASEIVAGALKDHNRAVVVGTKSFGKGSVQTLYPLINQKAAVKMTTSRYYTPAGISIQALGIEPDIEIKQEAIKEPENDWEKYIIEEADLEGALKNTDKKKDKKSKKDDDKDGEEEEEKPDYQLDRAVEIVKGIAIYAKASEPEVVAITKEAE